MDKLKFRGRMVAAGHTQRTIASALDISEHTISRKVNGGSDFTLDEVEKICALLNITDPVEKAEIFLP